MTIRTQAAIGAEPVPGLTASTPPQQQEMPLAMVRGQPMLQIPQDLYIPPDALEVILDAFEGPLDLLLYLIRRRSEEHTSELQSLMRISYAVFCLKKINTATLSQ